MNVLAAIGNTSLLYLDRIKPRGGARIAAKLEWENPTGSMKDRMAAAAIRRAEEQGRLKPGDTVIEYTGGSTGTSLALVCAVHGYRLRVVTSDAFSLEKRNHMAALGADLTVLPSEGGKATKQLFYDMIAEAQRLSREPRSFWFNQLENPDTMIGYQALGEEIWTQTNGSVTAFVQSVGTSASLRGATSALRRHKPDLHVVAVEPAESAVLGGGSPGAHDIEGIGIGRKPPLYDPGEVNEVICVGTDEAMDMARRLARDEGVFAGTSSGGNVLAALRVAERLPENAVVATLMIDSGMKYLSTRLYRR